MPSDINNPESISILDQITNEIDILYGLIQDFINARDYLRELL